MLSELFILQFTYNNIQEIIGYKYNIVLFQNEIHIVENQKIINQTRLNLNL